MVTMTTTMLMLMLMPMMDDANTGRRTWSLIIWRSLRGRRLEGLFRYLIATFVSLLLLNRYIVDREGDEGESITGRLCNSSSLSIY